MELSVKKDCEMIQLTVGKNINEKSYKTKKMSQTRMINESRIFIHSINYPGKIRFNCHL